MPDLVEFSKRGAIGVITVNNPPVNALAAGVRDGLLACMQQGQADAGVKAMILIGGGRTMIAGADIKEFGDFDKAGGASLHDVNAAYENSSKPIVAAIHGTALGGGLEICLACHYRVAVPSAQVGLPEVKLGLLPGAGGTQRIPRLVGVETALDMIARGRFVAAPKAKDLGIIDDIVDGDLLDGAVAFAEKLVADNAPLKKIRDLDVADDPAAFEAFEKQMAREARGYMAPQHCIKCVKAAVELPFDEGLKREGELFTEVLKSTQSKAQIHIFFGEREVAKIPDVPKDTAQKTIKTAAVLGAGTMGGGIAMNFANAGIPVKILEVDQAGLDRGLGIVAKNYANTVAKGRLSQAAMDERMGLIQPTLDYADIADADIVVEAVFEEMDIKKQVFSTLSEVMNREAILATNTSTLDVDEIASATDRPELVIGTHFFSPANVMRLLEVVRGAKSSKETIATAMALGKKIGKIAVLVGNCDGFVGNRMLAPYMRESEFLLEEGAQPEQVDKVFTDLGFAMGPFTMTDMAGVDVGWRIEKRRRLSRSDNLRTSYLVDRVCEAGRYGQKTGAGYYKYEPGNRRPIPDPDVAAMIEAESADRGIERREISDEEILKRCFYAMINEGAKCLEEGMALRAVDIDVIYTAGYGVPRYLGGPMFYADQVGLKNVYADVRRYHEELGGYWEPSPLLARLAEEGKGFRDL